MPTKIYTIRNLFKIDLNLIRVKNKRQKGRKIPSKEIVRLFWTDIIQVYNTVSNIFTLGSALCKKLFPSLKSSK
ncbi:MAG: hypothetical protein DRP54_02720 [Spirochaetes bacterium]|nr:MAG: hypothetical protein DRP54_02720 [Spirochaetota bacterium]